MSNDEIDSIISYVEILSYEGGISAIGQMSTPTVKEFNIAYSLIEEEANSAWYKGSGREVEAHPVGCYVLYTCTYETKRILLFSRSLVPLELACL